MFRRASKGQEKKKKSWQLDLKEGEAEENTATPSLAFQQLKAELEAKDAARKNQENDDERAKRERGRERAAEEAQRREREAKPKKNPKVFMEIEIEGSIGRVEMVLFADKVTPSLIPIILIYLPHLSSLLPTLISLLSFSSLYPFLHSSTHPPPSRFRRPRKTSARSAPARKAEASQAYRFRMQALSFTESSLGLWHKGATSQTRTVVEERAYTARYLRMRT